MRFLATSLAAAALVAATAACPPNTCFFEVCTNGVCHCPISSCVDGAEFNVKGKRCVCEADRISIDGQCLTQADADIYCGAGSRYTQRGCTRIACVKGQVFDEASKRCVMTAAVARHAGVVVGAGQKLGCPAGSKLVIEGKRAACVPLAQTCARDEVFDGRGCVKKAQCATGSSWDAAQGRCVQYAKTGESVAEVDVVAWGQLNYGPAGGRGSSAFCNQFTRKPWRFGVQQGNSATVQVAVQMSFSGAEVAEGQVATAASYAHTPTPIPAAGSQAIQEAAASMFETLKAGGGRANRPQATTTVSCVVVNAAPPVAVPATGGV